MTAKRDANKPDASAIAQLLQSRAVAAPGVLRSPELPPAVAGFYAWWSRRGALAGVPHIPHPLQEEVSLLYVGISPAREMSRQTIRSRVIGNHLNGNVGWLKANGGPLALVVVGLGLVAPFRWVGLGLIIVGLAGGLSTVCATTPRSSLSAALTSRRSTGRSRHNP
jgi:hypothetical protein